MNNNYWTNAPVNRACPLCNARDTQLVSHKMQYKLDLTTVICNKCGMVFTNPIPSEEIYNRFYVEAYASFYGHLTPPPPLLKGSPEPEHLKPILDSIERHRPLKTTRLLEVGPGKGEFLFYAKERGATVQGVEPSQTFHDILRRNDLPSLNTTLENVPDLGLDTFDCIAMFHVLEHFYDPNRALETSRKLLSENGSLVIIVPNILKPYRSLDHYFLRYVHLSNFSPFSLAAFLNKHGFSIVESTLQGKEHWNKPHNLFVIARKEREVPEHFTMPSQSAEEVSQFLYRYSLYWRYIKGPVWYLYQETRAVRQLARRNLGFIRRNLANRTIL